MIASAARSFRSRNRSQPRRTRSAPTWIGIAAAPGTATGTISTATGAITTGVATTTGAGAAGTTMAGAMTAGVTTAAMTIVIGATCRLTATVSTSAIAQATSSPGATG